MAKQSLRTDFLTRKKYPISELFRFVKENGYLTLAKTYETKGRGIYLRKDPSTLEAIKTPKALKRLGAKISEETLKEMEEAL